MKHLFVPYEIALKLKEKGFDEPCFTYYFPDGEFSDACEIEDGNDRFPGDGKFDEFVNDYDPEDEHFTLNVAAPTYQQVIDWFREKGFHFKEETLKMTVKSQYPDIDIKQRITNNSEYYEALNKAIEEALKLI